MNRYKEMKDRQQATISAYLNQYAFFAFSEAQFTKGLEKLGIAENEAKDRLYRLPGSGGFILKEHSPGFRSLLDQYDAELLEARTEPQFAFDMFYYELANHEYSYTGSTYETLEALNLSEDDIKGDPVLETAFTEAKKAVMRLE